MESIVYVKDFSKGCSADEALRQALAECSRRGASVLQLEAGEYHLAEAVTHKTRSIAHDEGCGDLTEKSCHLVLQGLRNFTIRGKTAEDGSPATLISGVNSCEIQALQPSILWVERCTGLTLENLEFTRRPESVCAGTVVSTEGGVLRVSIADGLNAYDGMAAYCMNHFNEDGTLAGPSLTYGHGFDARWKYAGGREYMLAAPEIAAKVRPGQVLSWHQAGKTDFLLYFGNCTDLTLKNLRILNTNGFAMITERCSGIKGDGVKISPRPGRYFTGPRDGWMVYRCTGEVLLDGCHFEGLRMDAQNVHGNFLVVSERLDKRTLMCKCRYAPMDLETFTGLKVYEGKGEKYFSTTILDWSVSETELVNSSQDADPTATPAFGGVAPYTYYRITLAEEPPFLVTEGTLCVAECWEPSLYTCRNTVFRNIAGAGHLLRVSHFHISDCIFEHMMNAGVLVGAELSTHSEGGHAGGAVIENCRFVHCGFLPRYVSMGCAGISIKSQGFHAPVNRDIRIVGNYFENCQVGVELHDAEQVCVENNTFSNVKTPVSIEQETTRTITVGENFSK